MSWLGRLVHAQVPEVEVAEVHWLAGVVDGTMHWQIPSAAPGRTRLRPHGSERRGELHDCGGGIMICKVVSWSLAWYWTQLSKASNVRVCRVEKALDATPVGDLRWCIKGATGSVVAVGMRRVGVKMPRWDARGGCRRRLEVVVVVPSERDQTNAMPTGWDDT